MSSIVTFYNCEPKDAPRTTMPARLGANVILTKKGKLLLERRRDSDTWGLVGGGCKPRETGREAIAREVYEELGLRIPKEKFRKLKVYDNPGRIAAYRDRSVWRMVIVVYELELEGEPVLRLSRESREAGLFSPEEVRTLQIPVTHRDIIEECFLNRSRIPVAPEI